MSDDDPRKTRVLFVGEDPRPARDLARAVAACRRCGWELASAGGADEARGMLAAAAVDAVVADLRAGGSEGAEVLEAVRQSSPAAARIALVRWDDQQAAARALEVAHRSLAEPSEPRELLEAVERACAVQALLERPALRRKLGGLSSLPVAPQIYVELTAAIADPEASARDIAAIVESDPGLSAKVLQAVNSSVFGLARPVASMHEGVTYLGIDMVRNLVMSASIMQQVDVERMPACFSVQAEHAHGIATGRLAAKLAPRWCASDAFLAGMLHDVGNLIMATELEDDFVRARETAISEALPLHRAEREANGYTHAEVGAWLLARWGLRHAVVEAVACHHEPGAVAAHEFDAVGAVHVADLLVQGRAGELDQAYLRRTGVLEALEEWDGIASRMPAAAAP